MASATGRLHPALLPAHVAQVPSLKPGELLEHSQTSLSCKLCGATSAALPVCVAAGRARRCHLFGECDSLLLLLPMAGTARCYKVPKSTLRATLLQCSWLTENQLLTGEVAPGVGCGRSEISQ